MRSFYKVLFILAILWLPTVSSRSLHADEVGVGAKSDLEPQKKDKTPPESPLDLDPKIVNLIRDPEVAKILKDLSKGQGEGRVEDGESHKNVKAKI